MRKAENQNPSLEEGNDTADHSYSSNPEEQAMQRDRIALVRQLINNLPEKQRSCMQLREFEGKSYKEIAQILGVTEEQVKINIFRARQQIKQQFIKTENYGL
jgi:RNA polymerase sigma-70 factor (ECF subfamily)